MADLFYEKLTKDFIKNPFQVWFTKYIVNQIFSSNFSYFGSNIYSVIADYSKAHSL